MFRLKFILWVALLRLFIPRLRRSWYGPKPSNEERNRNQHFIADYMARFPNNCGDLPRQFPDAYTRAMAYIQYERLNNQFARGEIDEIDFNVELGKILPLIDISDITPK